MAGRLAAVGLCVGLTAGLGISPAAADPAPKDVLKVYADIAQAGYADSVDTARTLKLAVDAFLAKPTEDNLRAARAAWIAARIPYMQTEAYRFGNAIVDDWEGKVNSWPLDEGLIDYVAAAYGTESPENELYVANVIAHTSLTIGGKKLDTSKITKELLAEKLQEAGGVEANVATGYHAVEFLLWGQDLNGTGPGNGARPASDFDTKQCTNGNCARRAQYLQCRHRSPCRRPRLDGRAMGARRRGAQDDRRRQRRGRSHRDHDRARQSVLWRACRRAHEARAHDPRSRGGARLLLRQHACLALLRRARHPQRLSRHLSPRRPQSIVTGPSVSDLVRAKSPEVDAEVRAKLDATMDAMNAMYLRALTTESYDQMIGEGNEAGNAVVQKVVDALLDQTKSIERAVATLDLKAIEFEGSDSLDNPSAVQAENKGASEGSKTPERPKMTLISQNRRIMT